MLEFKNTYLIDDIKNIIPDMMNIKNANRLMRTRKKYCLIVGNNVHLTNEPYILYIKKYFFTQLSKTTLILLNN
jgi:hypothetical protein